VRVVHEPQLPFVSRPILYYDSIIPLQQSGARTYEDAEMAAMVKFADWVQREPG